MKTYMLNTSEQEQVRAAYYEYAIINEITETACRDTNPPTEKWKEYLDKLRGDAYQRYDVLKTKLAYKYAPYDNCDYEIDPREGVINYRES